MLFLAAKYNACSMKCARAVENSSKYYIIGWPRFSIGLPRNIGVASLNNFLIFCYNCFPILSLSIKKKYCKYSNTYANYIINGILSHLYT